MIERIIDFIGRLLSAIFRKSNDIIDNTKTEYGMIKQQAKVAKVNTQSTLSVSVSGENHVNYFRNRVVGEFLRVMSSLVVYQYEKSSGKHVAYFVRHKRRSAMEYIKFSKDRLDDKEAFISYTYINKIISSTGVTTNVGRTDQKVLLVDDAISNCVYDSISGKKAPLYLVHVLGDKVGVGNPTFVYDTWILTTKLISKKVKAYIMDSNTRDGQLIETLMSQAGIHMYMSYFRSLSNPFYRTVYGKGTINTIVEAIKDYNGRHFNVNKILNFSFDYENKGGVRVDIDPSREFTTLHLYGVTIKFTGVISEVGENAARRFNYKFAESLLKSEDLDLRVNFLFYMFSTGGIDDQDIVRLNEQEQIEGAKTSDPAVTALHQRVEPAVKTVMEASNFEEGPDGDLASRDFEEFIQQDVQAKSKVGEVVVPKVDEVLVTYADTYATDQTTDSRIKSDNQRIDSEVKVTQASNTTDDRSDFVRRLEEEATGNTSGQRQVQESERAETIVVDDSKSFNELMNTPLTQWTSEDCMKVLGSEQPLNANITREDVLQRMMFLTTQNKG